jgi:uncharacterized protein YoxC
MKAAEFAAAHHDVTSTRAEMEELLDSHQGVVHKMKTLQDKARTINESLQEKARALDEATAAIDELEAKVSFASSFDSIPTLKARALLSHGGLHGACQLERSTRQVEIEKKAHTQVGRRV